MPPSPAGRLALDTSASGHAIRPGEQASRGGTTAEGGWLVTLKTGKYGTDYDQRAFVTAIGLGANLPQDAVYPVAKVDGAGQSLSGAKKYVIHFPKGQTPPAKGFWSITMYNDQYFFVDNPLNKYTVSPRNNLKTNADGSLDLYLQHESPGKGDEPNWLPAPPGPFIVMMRLYWPSETPPSILDGSWKPPPLTARVAPRVGRRPGPQ